MKLLRYGAAGHELPGLLDTQGRIRSLRGIVPDITHDVVSPEGLARLRAVDVDELPVVEGSPRFGPPIALPRQFMALGLNYASHAKEANVPIPAQPMVFSKAISSISGAGDDIPLYPGTIKLDYEAELAVVIGQQTFRIDEGQALSRIAGYCICNDVSERAWQIERGGTLSKGKSAPGYGPLGPWLVTTDDVPDPQQLGVRTRVNGELRQQGHTSDMIVSVASFVAHLSQYMTLLPGDVLATGTPAGVALGMQPPVWLRVGDLVQIEIDGLGEMRQRVVSADCL